MAMRALPISRLQPDLTRDAQLQDHALDLRFDLGRFDSRITFTRSSTATYFDAAGILKVANANEPRIDHDPVTKAVKGFLVEEARTNLLTYSEQFQDAVWGKAKTSVASDAGVSPSGEVNADRLIENSEAGGHFVSRLLTFGTGALSLAVYAKAGERSKIRLRSSDYVSAVISADFDLSSGTVITSSFGSPWTAGRAAITPVGSGWYRCELAATAGQGTSKTAEFHILDASGAQTYTGDGTSGIYIWGAQLEAGAFPTSYIPSSVSFTSRASPATYFDAQGVMRVAGHNLLTYSEEFDNAAWVKDGLTVSSDVAVAPDGTMSADRLNENAGGTFHTMRFPILANAVQRRYAISVKGDGRNHVAIGTAVEHAVLVNLSTGEAVVGSGSPSSIVSTPQGDGWWRIEFVATFSGGQPVFVYLLKDGVFANRSYAGDGVSGVFVWGAHVSEGAARIPYLKTTSAAVSEPRYGYGLVDGQWVAKGLELEAAATNLFTYSEHLDNSAWAKVLVRAIPNAGVAPDGTQTADKIFPDTTSGLHHITQSPALASSTTYTASAFVKQDGAYSIFAVEVYTGTAYRYVRFNLTTGVIDGGVGGGVSGGLTASIIPASNGFYRIAVTGTTAATGSAIFRFYFYNSGEYTFAGDGASGVLMWGAQLEAGPVATSYIPTTPTFTSRASTATYFDSTGTLKTAAVNEPRYGYGYVNGEWVPKGLELEAAATNSLTYSQDFDGAAWSRARVSVIPNATVAPDGTLSADKLVEDTTANNSHIIQRVAVPFTQGSYYAWSFFVKAAGRSRVRMAFSGYGDWTGGSGGDCIFDLVAKTAIWTANPGISKLIEDVGGGWFRCAIAVQRTAVSGSANAVLITDDGISGVYTGDGTSGVFLWGAQLEAGSIATSYIPTTTAAVTRAADVSSSTAQTRAADVSSSSATTRAADVATMTGANFSSWFNATEGAFVAQSSAGESGTPAAMRYVFYARDTPESNRITVRHGPNTTERGGSFFVYSGAVTQAYINNGAALTAGGMMKFAAAYKVNDFAFYKDGEAVGTDAAGTVPTGINQIQIGSGLNGHIKRLTYYPKRLSNSLLQKATQ